MNPRGSRYFAYMLRLWRGVSAGEATWRASLEDPQTGERRGFGDLTELFGFLSDQTGPEGTSPARAPTSSEAPPGE